MKSLKVAAAAAIALAIASPAAASVTLPFHLEFKSGAEFTGTVTFTDGLTSILDVDGQLSSYQWGAHGYVGSGSNHMHWVWNPGVNFATTSGKFTTFLMDGVADDYSYGSGYLNWITFTYDLNAPQFTFSAEGYGNNVNYDDPMVRANAVPEPAAWALMIAGFGVAGAGLRANRRRELAAAV